MKESFAIHNYIDDITSLVTLFPRESAVIWRESAKTTRFSLFRLVFSSKHL